MNEGAGDRILLVDDDEDLLQLLAIRLGRSGYTVDTAASGQEALALLEQKRPGLIVTDLRMDKMDGMQLLANVEKRFPLIPVIVLTAHGTIPDAVAATQSGAFGFLTKPFDDDELLDTVRRALEQGGGSTAAQSPEALEQWRSKILTRNSAMETLLQEAQMVAGSDASIVIQSQSGTGKELLASAIHEASPRNVGEFVAVNCTAIPEALFESELFGHAKGAFTGAHRDRVGLFQQAHQGTLFLDEIGDMPLDFQAKLLRVLQEKVVRPVGSERSVGVDVRVIAATHKDIEQAVANDEFREDLYYRLSVVTLEIPPLEERREDIPLLANHFLQLFAEDGVGKAFSPAAMEALLRAHWPGNVRQLANVVQHCKVLSRTELISDSLVERALKGKAEGLTPFAEARDRFELSYLSDVLTMTNGNVSQAARLAGRNRSEFYKLLSKHSIDPERFRVDDDL